MSGYTPNTKLPTLPPTPVVIVNNETGTPLDVTAISTSTAKGWSTVNFSGQVLVGVTSTLLLPANTSRVYTHIINNSNDIAWLQYGNDAVVGQGIRLNRGAMLTLYGYELFLGSINAISITPSLIDVLEGV